MRYRTKATIITEAVQWTGKNIEEVRDFLQDPLITPNVHDGVLTIRTMHGNASCRLFDYVVKSTEDFYPCSKVVFETKYELA